MNITDKKIELEFDEIEGSWKWTVVDVDGMFFVDSGFEETPQLALEAALADFEDQI